MKVSDWTVFIHCKKKKKIQQDITLDVSMMITDIIKAPMSFLLSALLLRHLFNPEHYCPYGVLTSLKFPSFGDHLLL